VVLRLLDKQAGRLDLSRLDPKALNIMTVEDPIEYDLDGINQTQTNNRIDMSFARALRTILRQDPDVIMIGEIRDLESAEIAIQASLTGHLVLSTLHTNDAVSAVTRLVDMGVEPFLLASSLIGIGAQRLVRKLCLECRAPLAPDAAQCHRLGLTSVSGHFHAPRGCGACNRTGYKGRTGIYELLTVNDESRRLIHDRVDEQMLRRHATACGMGSLREDGMRLAAAGTVSLEEVLRVTRPH
jgi:general secretion pathway protein E